MGACHVTRRVGVATHDTEYDCAADEMNSDFVPTLYVSDAVEEEGPPSSEAMSGMGTHT